MTDSLPVVFVLLDAFRWDYLTPKDTPELWRMAQDGLRVRQIRPSFGFCEIAEYATGARPGVTGKFTQITFARTRTSRAQQIGFPLLDVAERAAVRYRGRGSTRLGNWIARDLVRSIAIDPAIVDLRYRIPLSLLPLLRMPESSRYTETGAMGTETLFDVLRRAGGTIDDSGFVIRAKVSGSDEDRVNRLINSLNTSEGKRPDLTLLYLGDCDGAGHVYGPDSPETRRAAGNQSRRVARIVEAFRRRSIPARIIVLGDHGMLPVSSYVDAGACIAKAARAADLRPFRDYLLFLDSTMVRIWFNSVRAGEVLSRAVQMPPFSSKGTLLTRETAEHLGVPGPGPDYGDIIWLARAGSMVFPDFFNEQPPVGMHGYLPHLDEQKGMAVLTGEGIPAGSFDEAELIDLCPTVCRILDIPFPSSCHGSPLI